ncbi:MAG TPA: hypothetical protein VHE37_02305 [Nevskiaceae bacterium]|nr:hypothetical protein [Nevskiaceae bacterium]
MYRIMTAAAVGVALGTAMLASAASRDESQPEARAYMNLSFGGNAALPKNFHYGMRLDYDHRFVSHPMPPMLQMDFTDNGFSDARFNGLPFVRRYYLNQAEGAVAAGAAGAGTASTVTVVDWTLLAAGAAGLGVAGYEVSSNSKSDTAPATSGTSTGGGSNTGNSTGGSTTGGSTTGGSTTGGSTTGGSTTGGSTTGGSTTGGLLGFAEYGPQAEATRHTAEYQEWLDGGTGQMGDLAPVK